MVSEMLLLSNLPVHRAMCPWLVKSGHAWCSFHVSMTYSANGKIGIATDHVCVAVILHKA